MSVAVVSGAASGIGAEVVRGLAARGIGVAAIDQDVARLTETVDALASTGAVRAFPADVRQTDKVERAIDDIESDFGAIAYLVNAAGILRPDGASTVSDEDWEDSLAVNAGGVVRLSRAVCARMIPRRVGSIVTVTSNAAVVPRMGMAAYAASKAASKAYTRCLGLELAPLGIRCNTVSPGSTDTPMLHGLHTGADAAVVSVSGRPDEFRLGIPLGKVAHPRDIAAGVLFLLSDDAGHITLHDLTIDGGATLGV